MWLNVFNVNKNLMTLFYGPFSNSVLTFGLTVWYGNLKVINTNHINRVIKGAGRIIAEQQLSLSEIFNRLSVLLT